MPDVAISGNTEVFYELYKLRSLPTEVPSEQNYRGVRVLRLPGYCAGGQDHAP